MKTFNQDSNIIPWEKRGIRERERETETETETLQSPNVKESEKKKILDLSLHPDLHQI